MQETKTKDIKKQSGIMAAINKEFDIPVLAKIAAGPIIGSLSGVTYFNWSPYHELFVSKGAYKYVCPSDSVTDPVSLLNCEAQAGKIRVLSDIIISVHMIFSFVAGYLTDKFSPKLVCLLGLFFQLIGWTLLSLSSNEFRMFIPASILIGMGADTSFFPLFSLARYRPELKNTIIALSGTGRSVSFIIPLIALKVAEIFKMSYTFGFLYTHLFCILISILTAFIALPNTTNKEIEQIDLEITSEKEKTTFKDSLLNLISFFKNPYFLAIIPYACNNLIRPTFLNSASALILSKNMVKYLQLLGTFSFLPCPFMGMLVDKIGIFPVMQIMNGSGLLSVLTLLFSILGGQVYIWELAFIGFHTFAMSFNLSQVYCYASILFPPESSNLMMGLIMAISGVSVLLNTSIFNLSNKYGFAKIFIGLAIVSFAMSLLALVLWILSRKVVKKQKV